METTQCKLLRIESLHNVLRSLHCVLKIRKRTGSHLAAGHGLIILNGYIPFWTEFLIKRIHSLAPPFRFPF